MAFQVLHGLAPPYLNQLARVADLPKRRRLRSASSHQLLVPPFRLTTVGRLTFPSLLWNAMPSDVQVSSSLSAFRQRLKTVLFRQSFPGIVLWSHYVFVVNAIVFAILATLKNYGWHTDIKSCFPVTLNVKCSRSTHNYTVVNEFVHHHMSSLLVNLSLCVVYCIFYVVVL